MRVAYSPAALRDLTAIQSFIALDNRRRATSFVAELRTACRSLGTDSSRYPIQFERSGARRMPVGSYLVFYRVLPDSVQIIRVVHSARDLGRLGL